MKIETLISYLVGGNGGAAACAAIMLLKHNETLPVKILDKIVDHLDQALYEYDGCYDYRDLLHELLPYASQKKIDEVTKNRLGNPSEAVNCALHGASRKCIEDLLSTLTQYFGEGEDRNWYGDREAFHPWELRNATNKLLKYVEENKIKVHKDLIGKAQEYTQKYKNV